MYLDLRVFGYLYRKTRQKYSARIIFFSSELKHLSNDPSSYFCSVFLVLVTHWCLFLFLLRTFSWYFMNYAMIERYCLRLCSGLCRFHVFLLLFSHMRHTERVFLELMLVTGGWIIYFESCVICMSSLSSHVPSLLHEDAGTGGYFIRHQDICFLSSCKTVVFHSC